ncbi:MAG TPA: PEP/pyruvate-binding domain-containing protein [Vicinamibacteria bacterium]|nr:PEP/pyruvate-binding domain-containing protein [Vicinamibacteria bacterium]
MISAPPSFARRFFGAEETFTVVGSGEIGGKAAGLRRAREALLARPAGLRFECLPIEVPTLTVIGTAVFEEFLRLNRLDPAELATRDDREIAHAFQRGELPPTILGDLWALVREVRTPLAVRSSSLLEDALSHPFAGVYATKMTPNGQLDPEARFRRLTEAIKFVFASTFLESARAYRTALGGALREAMAVIVQEVVGRRHGPRFYPDVSCVARSLNFYPFGPARPEDGVMSLALGLGKQIVDGGRCFTVSPRHPRSGPPFASTRDVLDETQASFWAINVGPPPAYDPTAESEYLVGATLDQAEQDGALTFAASTYDPGRDRIVAGLAAKGPRVLDFAPLRLWEELPWNDAVAGLLAYFEDTLAGPVEIELAATLGADRRGRLGFLQVRPVVASGAEAAISDEELKSPAAVVVSERALGNGAVTGLRDVVFLRPPFELRDSRAAARDLVEINRALLAEGRPYLLIGFGRWGSSDPWLGVPVEWGQVAGARALVEASPEGRGIELSQGSHFFHNLLGLGVPYLQVAGSGGGRIDWEYLLALPRVRETPRVIHARCGEALRVRADGRRGRGLVLAADEGGRV